MLNSMLSWWAFSWGVAKNIFYGDYQKCEFERVFHRQFGVYTSCVIKIFPLSLNAVTVKTWKYYDKTFFTLFEWSLSDFQEHIEPTMIGSTTFEVV